MLNYKGLLHGKSIIPHYYEGGAHFKYSELIDELNKLIIDLPPNRLTQNPEEEEENDTISIEKQLFKQKIKRHRNANYINTTSKKSLKVVTNLKTECTLPDIKLNIYKNNNFNTLNLNKLKNEKSVNMNENILPKIHNSYRNIIDNDSIKEEKEDNKYIIKKNNKYSVQNSNKKSKPNILIEDYGKEDYKLLSEERRDKIIDKIIGKNKNVNIKKNSKVENDMQILKRIEQIKKQLLCLNNMKKKVKLIANRNEKSV